MCIDEIMIWVETIIDKDGHCSNISTQVSGATHQADGDGSTMAKHFDRQGT